MDIERSAGKCLKPGVSGEEALECSVRLLLCYKCFNCNHFQAINEVAESSVSMKQAETGGKVR